jgi:hypothetical protein
VTEQDGNRDGTRNRQVTRAGRPSEARRSPSRLVNHGVERGDVIYYRDDADDAADDYDYNNNGYDDAYSINEGAVLRQQLLQQQRQQNRQQQQRSSSGNTTSHEIGKHSKASSSSSSSSSSQARPKSSQGRMPGYTGHIIGKLHKLHNTTVFRLCAATFTISTITHTTTTTTTTTTTSIHLNHSQKTGEREAIGKSYGRATRTLMAKRVDPSTLSASSKLARQQQRVISRVNRDSGDSSSRIFR